MDQMMVNKTALEDVCQGDVVVLLGDSRCGTNINSIATAIRAAIESSEEERIRMGVNSYNRIRNLCSSEAVLQQWREIFRNHQEGVAL